MIDYNLVFTNLVQRKNKRARTTQASPSQDQDEEDEYAYIDELDKLDEKMEDIPVREERDEQEVPRPLMQPTSHTSPFDEFLVYQLEMMNIKFDAMEKIFLSMYQD